MKIEQDGAFVYEAIFSLDVLNMTVEDIIRELNAHTAKFRTELISAIADEVGGAAHDKDKTLH